MICAIRAISFTSLIFVVVSSYCRFSCWMIYTKFNAIVEITNMHSLAHFIVHAHHFTSTRFVLFFSRISMACVCAFVFIIPFRWRTSTEKCAVVINYVKNSTFGHLFALKFNYNKNEPENGFCNNSCTKPTSFAFCISFPLLLFYSYLCICLVENVFICVLCEKYHRLHVSSEFNRLSYLMEIHY